LIIFFADTYINSHLGDNHGVQQGNIVAQEFIHKNCLFRSGSFGILDIQASISAASMLLSAQPVNGKDHLSILKDISAVDT
jgi:hypothetical protein